MAPIWGRDFPSRRIAADEMPFRRHLHFCRNRGSIRPSAMEEDDMNGDDKQVLDEAAMDAVFAKAGRGQIEV
jgi:hypothetical protein